MATVYLARESGHVGETDPDGRLVAIKVLNQSFAADAGVLAKFKAESRLVGDFHHNNIVRVYARGVVEGHYFIVMEYMPNGTLDVRLRDGRASTRAPEIAQAMAGALAYAHARRVIHRDVKPANILFTDEDLPVLSDFGIAKSLDVETLPGKGVWGTIAYMAPEQWRNDRITSAIDVYALGLVFYDMLVGRVPSPEMPRSPETVDLTLLPQSASKFTTIIEHCIEVDPAQRATADEVARSLAELVDVAASTRRRDPDSRPPVLSRRRLWSLGVLSVFVTATLAWLVADRLWKSNTLAPEPAVASATPVAPIVAPETSAISQKSIAVLPFTDMSEGKDQEYLADGMAEEIINLLVNVPGLYVPARTSSFYFKGKPTRISEVARELGVAQVLEGSIRLSGNRLRVTAQLVRADTGYDVWSERYDRELHDIFEVQDEIASAVAQAMQIQLMGGTLARRKGGTENLEAYQLYLQAESATGRHTKASLDESDAYLQQALQLDSNYGMAWCLMSTNAITRADSGFLPAKDGYERARALAQKALQLSPDLARAHAGLQAVHRTLDWDWGAAEADERRAVALDPNDPWPLVVGGVVAASLGRWDDAERKLRAALTHDPLNTFALWNLALTYYNAGRYTDVEATIHRLLELAPDFLWAHAYLGKTYLAQGNPQAALEMVQQESDEWVRLWFLPIVLRAAGRNEDAEEALNALIARTTPGSGPYFVAMNYAYRGETDLAFEWLERAYRERDFALVEIVGEVLFKNIANDPRFTAFLVRMKLPTEWTTRIPMPRVNPERTVDE